LAQGAETVPKFLVKKMARRATDKTKSHHFANHDELRPKLFGNTEHAQNAEEEHHVIEREYNSRRIETRATERQRNASKYQTASECHE